MVFGWLVQGHSQILGGWVSEFKVGDRVRLDRKCSWNTDGEFELDKEYVVSEGQYTDRFGDAYVGIEGWGKGWAAERFELVEAAPDPEPRTAYIAGPMSGIENHNIPAFFEAAELLKRHGYNVENPADNDGATVEAAIEGANANTRTRADYMKLDIPRLLKSDLVVLLDGWQQSSGARLEATIAEECGIPQMELKHLVRVLPQCA